MSKEIRFTTDGNRFDKSKAREITSINWSHNDTSGSDLWLTASGNFVACNWSRWQGVRSYWDEISAETAERICLKELPFDKVLKLFPDLEKNYKDTI